MLTYIQFKMLFQCPLILLPKILLFLSLSRISAINLLLISLYCKNCLFIFQPILCNPCEDLHSLLSSGCLCVFKGVWWGPLLNTWKSTNEQVLPTKDLPYLHVLIILQEPDGFVEHDFPLQSCIEFLPVYHIYPSSLPCTVISTKFIRLTRL